MALANECFYSAEDSNTSRKIMCSGPNVTGVMKYPSGAECANDVNGVDDLAETSKQDFFPHLRCDTRIGGDEVAVESSSEEAEDSGEPVAEGGQETREVSALKTMVASLREQLQATTDKVVACEGRCGNETADEEPEAATGLEEGGATGGEEETAAQVRAEVLGRTVEFLRAARERDVAMLAWVHSANRTNSSGQMVLEASQAVKALHDAARAGRRKYGSMVAEANRSVLLHQLDDEALAAVPSYGSELISQPFSDGECVAIQDLSRQCPAHFGCNAQDGGGCVSCSTAGPCGPRSKVDTAVARQTATALLVLK